MPRRREIIELHKKELKLEVDSIRAAILHCGSKGFAAESVFRQILRRYLPERYRLASGFVINDDKVSHQHDIVVYDDFMNVPIYLRDGLGSFLGGTVYGVLETTIVKLNKSKLEDDIKKMADLRKLFPEGKVAFQKVVSCPIINEEEFKTDLGYGLSSGRSIDDFWPEIKEKCISEESAFIGDISKLQSVEEYEKIRIGELLDEYARRSQRFVVKETVIYSTPPPRTYLCALDGADYGTVEALAEVVELLTKSWGAHIHGLLVLNNEGDDWLLATRAFSSGKIEVRTQDAFFVFIEKMKCDFQGMLVGKFPAADENVS